MGGEDLGRIENRGIIIKIFFMEIYFQLKRERKEQRKKTEEAGKNKPVRSIPSGSLFQLLPLAFCLEFLTDFPAEESNCNITYHPITY